MNGGFTDANGKQVRPGDKVLYQFKPGVHTIGEIMQDGDADITFEDGSHGCVKWVRCCKATGQPARPLPRELTAAEGSAYIAEVLGPHTTSALCRIIPNGDRRDGSAIAAEMVKRWNAHSALVDALADAREFARSVLVISEDRGAQRDAQKVVDDCNAALTAAGAQGTVGA